MNRAVLWIFVAVAPILQGGVLPVPNWTVDAYGVESTVVDADTRAPVPHAKILDDVDDRVKTKRIPSGIFGCRWCINGMGAALFKPLSSEILPITTDLTSPVRGFRVEAPGYPTQSFTAYPATPEPLPNQVTATEIRKNVLRVPYVLIRRHIATAEKETP